MKKNIIYLTIFLFSSISFSQVVGEIELKKGDILKMYAQRFKDGTVNHNIFSMHGQTIYYFNKKGKKKNLNHSKIKKLTTSSETYLSLPISSLGAKRLQKVVAENDKYLLTDYYSINRFQFYIFEKSKMKAVEKHKIQTYRAKKEKKRIKIIKKYFGNCTELMRKIQSNYDSYYIHKNYYEINNIENTNQYISILFGNISNYKCQ